MTKIDKVIKALKSKPLTAAQIRARFDVPNVSAVIYDIRRRNDFSIVYRTTTKNGTMAYGIR